MNEPIHIATDWWNVSSTIFSGIITAIATIGAVIYTNYRTQKQLKEQADKYEQERIEQFKQSKYVVIKPTLLLNSFINILDQIIIYNDNNRMLLFSGDDGFEFFDDFNRRANQKCRILCLENNSENDIKDVILTTKSNLLNMSTEERCIYETQNATSLVRSKENIIIRLTNQVQFDKILEMNKNNVPSLLDFFCKIEYTTMANQRIIYIYQIKISNDMRIENIKDGVENITDLYASTVINPTIFRNLQDYVSGIDRSAYFWEKMGQAQMRGVLSQYNPMQQNINNETQENTINNE